MEQEAHEKQGSTRRVMGWGTGCNAIVCNLLAVVCKAAPLNYRTRLAT
ncbi:hypothetical protein FHR92_004647 [Fontibacillus solani]|uniref:Uncharacterized protein n=1 Tax=Fontibacillus solani TaxID=1572857 RepID=A0A7W3SXP0_9BACL|nr:hypothetical protein [Fontibacillus solani]MBA9088151.1 hypothetical protein [Fontibacillus solani]